MFCKKISQSQARMEMNPSFNSNGDNQARNSFFCNYNNDIDYSRTPREHYYPPSSSFFHLHSPHYIPLQDQSIFCDLFQQAQDTSSTTNLQFTMEMHSNNNGQIGKKDGDDGHDQHNAPVEPKNRSERKRSSKKDRHSKINTARGPRDRRMRLSLDVAKKFFGLQDLLGFEKASKTVEWLLTESKTSIQQLLPHQNCSFMGVSNSASSTSECEVLSGIDDQVIENSKAKSSYISKEKAKIVPRVRKSADLHHPIAKETRERARARARERTVEKRYDKLGCGVNGQNPKFRTIFDQEMDHGVNRLGCWVPFGENQVQIVDQSEQQSSHFQNPSLMTGNWGSSYNLFNYQHSSGLSSEVIMDVDT